MIDENTLPCAPRHRGFRSLGRAVVVTALLSGTVGTLAGGSTAHAVANDDWLGIVNTYRAMSGLAPVSANPTWSAEAQAHSCYMLDNGITHDEIPGRPGYTSGGDIAGNNGNVAVSSSISASPRNHIDLWMTGPFHAIGILRHNLTASGFGLCANGSTPTPWHSGGTLDVLRGLDSSQPRPSSPIVFPGNGATVALTSFITETPNPMTLCGWSGSAGLPLIAMMPNRVSSANATITGPNGPVATCVLHEGNTGGDATARAILGADNAVIVMPRDVLADGTYTVTVNSNGGDVTWSFNVDHNAPLDVRPPDVPDTAPTAPPGRFDSVQPFRHVDSRQGLGAVRLRAGQITEVMVATSDVAAVSANFVAVDASDHGYLTTYNCMTQVPTVSTINYAPGAAIANQAVVPLQNGKMCLYSRASVDVVIDINGYYRSSGGAGFVPVTPVRLYDSRDPGNTILVPGSEHRLTVTNVSPGAPAGAVAVALNATVVLPDSPGYLQVYPCGGSEAHVISNINFQAGDVRPNAVVTAVSDSGEICIRSISTVDVVIDFAGYFVQVGGYDLVPLDPIRIFDSRSGYAELNPVTGGNPVFGGQVITVQIAGRRGVPTDAKAVSVNLTATNAANGSFLTAYPCGERPTASNVNILPNQAAVANAAMVKLSSSGTLCIYALTDTHVIIDINGAWL